MIPWFSPAGADRCCRRLNYVQNLAGCPRDKNLGIMQAMSLASHIQAWRLFRGQSVHALAEKAGLSSASLDAIESGQLDPSASTLEGLAAAMEIPPPWLYMDPKHWVLLTEAENVGETTPEHSIDPVTEQVLRGAEQERELYVLLTAVLQSGEPKLRLAAEASLRSLATQARQLTVPWQGRPPGHFEPPSD